MERPILMSGPMVRAILEGRKTQTRRIVKPQPHNPEVSGVSPVWGQGAHRDGIFRMHAAFDEDGRRVDRFLPCPYGVPGDTLWVREMHQIATGHMYDGEAAVRYAADGAIRAVTDERSNAAPRSRSLSGRWRPSIHMPRWASRLTLRVESVRVERVQEISEADARAEGVAPVMMDHGSWLPGFEGLWDRINGARAPWASNPWVWVVTFSRVEVG